MSMKLQDIGTQQRDDLIEVVSIGIDRNSNDLGTAADAVRKGACNVRLDVARALGKNMKPIWVAPRSTARSTASGVFNPQILISGLMAAKSHEITKESSQIATYAERSEADQPKSIA